MGFIIVAVSALTLIYGYTGLRLFRPARLSRNWKISLWGILFLLYIALPIAIYFRHQNPDGLLVIPLSWFAYLTFGFFTLTFAALFLRDISLMLYWCGKGLISMFQRFLVPSQQENLSDPARRGFLVNSTNLAILGVTGSLTGYGVAQARQIPEVVTIDIPLNNLPPAFHGFRILQITDLHVSQTIRRDYVRGVVETAMAQQPDMVAITGDLADGSVDSLRSETAPLSDLAAPYGKYFVTGNHEYYAGVDAWLEEITRLGFTPLLNEHRRLTRNGSEIVLAGITDYRASQIDPQHASNPKKALAGAPEGRVNIMLAHQPKSIFQAEAAGADLLITGHTHGGQFFPWNHFVSLDQPYVQGLHRHGNTQIYVSRGTGYWGPPMRVGAPSEITVLHLKRAVES